MMFVVLATFPMIFPKSIVKSLAIEREKKNFKTTFILELELVEQNDDVYESIKKWHVDATYHKLLPMFSNVPIKFKFKIQFFQFFSLSLHSLHQIDLL